MDSFLDNQEVTAKMLNDIAADLGAAEFNMFGDEKFGVDELNGITKDLVTKGILQTGNQCRAVKSGERVNIQDGVIVFESGAKKRIDEPVSLEMMRGAYIYALNNTAQNNIQLIISQQEPSAGDFVMIAETGADGSLTDRRVFSSGKHAPNTGNFSVTKTEKVTIWGQTKTQFIEFNYSGFKYLLYRPPGNNSTYVDLSDNEEHFEPLGRMYIQKNGTGINLRYGGAVITTDIEFTVI